MEVISDTNKAHVCRYRFYPSLTSCGVIGTPQSSYMAECSRSRVSSYRGKKVQIVVGSKKRKRFNAFERYKYEMSSGTRATVCVPTSRPYVGWVDNFPLHDVGGITEAANPQLSYGVSWDGNLPPMGLYMLRKMANEHLDFTIRDLYVKAQSPRWNVSVFFAELDETLVGIKDLFLGTVKATLRVAERKRTLKNLAKSPEGLWLWYRYMLMPLILTVEELLTVFTKQYVQPDRIQDGSKAKPEQLSGTMRRLKYGYGLVNVEIPWEATVSVGCGAAMDIRFRKDPAPWGTSLVDVISGAYERITLSFVLDWLFNIGDWITTLRHVELDIAQSYATYAMNANVKFLDGTFTQIGGMPTCDSFLMRRVLNVEPPKFPLIDKRWRNTLRTLDSIALSIGLIKGLITRR